MSEKIFLKTLLLFLPLFALTLVHFGHIAISSGFGEFVTTFSERTGGAPDLATFVIKELHWILSLYSKPLVLLGLIGLFLAALKVVVRKKPDPLLAFTLLFFGYGFFQWLTVSRIVWIHDYMLIYFLPFFIFASAVVYRFLEKNLLFKKTVILFLFAPAIITLSSFRFTQALLDSKDQTAQIYTLANYINTKNSTKPVLFLASDVTSFEIRYPRHYFYYYANLFPDYRSQIPNNLSRYSFIVRPLDESAFAVYEVR